MSRIIIMTGKGGVGKSSIAAAHAVKSARKGAKTLLVSTDMAHNIADIFGLPVGGNVTPLSENLYGLELDQIMKEEFPEMNRSIGKMFSEAGFAANKVADDMMFPGFDDLFSLLKIAKIKDQGEYERIIVDCAPTGETLSLLRYPERLSVIADKILPMVRNMNKAFGSLISRKTTVPKPRDLVFAEFDQLIKRLNALRKILQNREITSLRIVMSPERIGHILYGDVNPDQVFCKEEAFRMEDQDGTRVFVVHLPYAREEELSVEKDGKELTLRFRNERRRFRLPDKLVRRHISRWEYGHGELKIYMDYE